VFQHHPNGPFSYLWRIPRCSCHDSILSNFGVSGNPGAVQRLRMDVMKDAATQLTNKSHMLFLQRDSIRAEQTRIAIS